MSKITPPQDQLEDLFNGLLDKTLSLAEETRLAGMLAESAEARGRYRKWMELHAALHWDYAGAATHVPGSSVQIASAPLLFGEASETGNADQRAPEESLGLVRRSLIVSGALAAAGLLTLAIGWSALLQRPLGHAGHSPANTVPQETDAIVEVASLHGAASWSDGGRVVSDLAVGSRLAAGNVSLEGESAILTLRFDDGTVVTLNGESMLQFDTLQQKSLLLRHGTLSVDAQPQQPGRPMIIRTATAEVEVLGTVFSVMADSSETQLDVEEGSVRLRRLADGQMVDVAEHHTATVSLATVMPIAANRPVKMPANYRQTFDGTSRARFLGEWLAAETQNGQHGEKGLPARARSVPYVAGRNADGTPTIYYGVTVREQDPGFVTLHDDSVVSVRFRTDTPQPLQLMIGTRRPGGSFGGNFEASVAAETAIPDDAGEDGGSGGWLRLEVPTRDFMPICPGYSELTPGNVMSMLLVDTYSIDAHLEVAEVSVSRQAARADFQ